MSQAVLMICEGNICRSPLAAAWFAHVMPWMTVSSAGTHALVDKPADPMASAVAQAHDLTLDSHVGTQIDAPLVARADLILTMTRMQRDWIETAWPFARGKVFQLDQEEGIDVIDPYRRHRTMFDLAFAQIRQGVSQWSRLLKEVQ
jgi:protein-tyrosine phosphatase